MMHRSKIFTPQPKIWIWHLKLDVTLIFCICNLIPASFDSTISSFGCHLKMLFYFCTNPLCSIDMFLVIGAVAFSQGKRKKVKKMVLITANTFQPVKKQFEHKSNNQQIFFKKNEQAFIWCKDWTARGHGKHSTDSGSHWFTKLAYKQTDGRSFPAEWIDHHHSSTILSPCSRITFNCWDLDPVRVHGYAPPANLSNSTAR